ncbi:MAG: pyridoxamine 5'-phosphate oxidase family protein [Chitinophagaceae bacterium]|nr:pyridoxamine 5'-phosphate oxidase family protein [Bacteroidota bacterium]MCC6256968.1 pyridoxamine 5'-phosphate oxidase family protein [Chitinophagaceae bacterium]MCW5917018.1 pyridoxamine 5'-phosphate oxidase family protein [Ferruginibacter sp.]
MIGKLNNEEIETLLHNQVIARLAIVYGNKPYVVPISYAYDGTFIYGFAKEGLKMEMMRKNPNVCIEVENTENIANWQSVISWGQFEELKSGRDRKYALEVLNKRILPVLNSETMRLSPLWPFITEEDTQKLEGIAFRIKLETKTGRFEKSPQPQFYPAR